MLQSFKPPKDTKDYEWTNHVVRKMQYYRLGEGRVKRVVRHPKRKEVGIAEGTIAVMAPSRLMPKEKPARQDNKGDSGKQRWKEEIWVMYVEVGNPSKISGQVNVRKKIISAWRYPGVSPKGEQIPIPDDIREELKGIAL